MITTWRAKLQTEHALDSTLTMMDQTGIQNKDSSFVSETACLARLHFHSTYSPCWSMQWTSKGGTTPWGNSASDLLHVSDWRRASRSAGDLLKSESCRMHCNTMSLQGVEAAVSPAAPPGTTKPSASSIRCPLPCCLRLATISSEIDAKAEHSARLCVWACGYHIKLQMPGPNPGSPDNFS